MGIFCQQCIEITTQELMHIKQLVIRVIDINKRVSYEYNHRVLHSNTKRVKCWIKSIGHTRYIVHWEIDILGFCNVYYSQNHAKLVDLDKWPSSTRGDFKNVKAFFYKIWVIYQSTPNTKIVKMYIHVDRVWLLITFCCIQMYNQ